jgi:hypothetical protein
MKVRDPHIEKPNRNQIPKLLPGGDMECHVTFIRSWCKINILFYEMNEIVVQSLMAHVFYMTEKFGGTLFLSITSYFRSTTWRYYTFGYYHLR